MKLYELRQNDLDDDIEKTAQSIGKNRPGTMNGPGPQGLTQPTNGQNSPQQETDLPDEKELPNQPDRPETRMYPENNADLRVEKTKSISDQVLRAVSGHPYFNYDFRGTRINPQNILRMDMPDLLNLRTLIRTKLGLNNLQDQFGLYDRPDMKYYHDMIRFVDRIITARKQIQREQPNHGRRPPIKKVPEPKHIKPGPVRPKRPKI